MQRYGKSGCHLQTTVCKVDKYYRSKPHHTAYLEHVHVSQNLRSTDRQTLWAATQCVQELRGVCIQLQLPPDELRAIFKRNIRHQETNHPLWQTTQAGWYSNLNMCDSFYKTDSVDLCTEKAMSCTLSDGVVRRYYASVSTSMCILHFCNRNYKSETQLWDTWY